MKPIDARLYDRTQALYDKLRAIKRDEEAGVTCVRGEAFDNEAWLEAERDALVEKRLDLEITTDSGGTFKGFAEP